MIKIVILFLIGVILGFTQSCAKPVSADLLQKELADYIQDKDATIGVAVIVDRKDTVMVNGTMPFPMLSVYKFPIAVALGDYLRNSAEMIPDSIPVEQSDLRPDTYSPMREKYEEVTNLRLPFYEILAYALQQSDNNASDILLRIMGGTGNAMHSLRRLGIENVNIISTEAEMHDNNELCFQNSSTPVDMAKMLDNFAHDFSDPYSNGVKQLMESCETGGNRLAKPLAGKNARLGHKTGTGFTLPNGRLMAINDVGYVHLPDGRNYSIAVFIENSAYDRARTEEIIAQISAIVFNHVTENWQ